MPLTRDQIIDAAIRILDVEGPDGLSMRHLGTELDAGATSIYWHVKGKDDLLDLVADRLLGEILAGLEPADTWRGWMAAFARSMRRVLLAHPGVAPVVGRRVGLGPNALLALEGVFPCWPLTASPRILDARDDDTGGLDDTLVLAEAREMREGTWPADAGTLLAAGDRPGVTAMLRDGTLPTADERFEYGLEVLLEGIDAREARHGRRTGGTSRDHQGSAPGA